MSYIDHLIYHVLSELIGSHHETTETDSNQMLSQPKPVLPRPQKSLWITQMGHDQLQIAKVIDNSIRCGFDLARKFINRDLPILILTEEEWKVKSLAHSLSSTGCSVEIRDVE